MRELIDSASAVLFDFDGPVCDLFHGHPALFIAARFRELSRDAGDGSTPGWMPDTDDPYRILLAAARQPSSNGLLPLLEDTLTQEELRAAPDAYPTAYADRLIQALRADGRRLAIATNNSQSAVERYLGSRRLEGHFAGHIHGRTPKNLRLKPDPDCLRRALDSTGTRARDALMIGDAVRDFAAARAAGVPFLGYAHSPEKAAALRAAGVPDLVGSLADVLQAVDPAARI